MKLIAILWSCWGWIFHFEEEIEEIEEYNNCDPPMLILNISKNMPILAKTALFWEA